MFSIKNRSYLQQIKKKIWKDDEKKNKINFYILWWNASYKKKSSVRLFITRPQAKHKDQFFINTHWRTPRECLFP